MPRAAPMHCLPLTSKIEGGNVGAESGSEIRVFSPMDKSDLIWNFRSELGYDSDIRPITSRVIENHKKSLKTLPPRTSLFVIKDFMTKA